MGTKTEMQAWRRLRTKARRRSQSLANTVNRVLDSLSTQIGKYREYESCASFTNEAARLARDCTKMRSLLDLVREYAVEDMLSGK